MPPLRPLPKLLSRRGTPTTPLCPYFQQQRYKSSNAGGAPNGPREGTGKVGYDKFRPVDRRSHKMPAQKSMLVGQKEMMRTRLPNDLGLLLGTLIMPKNMPSLTSEPRRRIKMESQRLFKRLKDFASIISYIWIQKPRLKIHFLKTAPTAQALHRQMYTALADGDSTTLNSLTCEGLRTHLTTLLSTRPRHATYSWTLHRYIGKPTVFSHRAAILPIDDGSGTKTGIRQAVVRIRSIQSLRRTDAKASAEEAKGEEREVEEFVVVQKRVWRGTEERWRVWGTTTPTSLESWESVINPKIGGEEEVKGNRIGSGMADAMGGMQGMM